MTPKATTNGTIGAIPESCCSLTARYDCVASTAPGGSARASTAASALRAAAEPAEENRYSICAEAGVTREHDLAGPLRPAALLQVEVIQRPARGGPADQRDRRRGERPAGSR